MSTATIGHELPAAARGSAASVVGAAVRELGPIFVGLIPFALLLGVTMAEADISPGVGLVGALLIYTGTANLSAVVLLDDGAGLVAIVATVAVVSSRFVMYAAAIEHRFRGQPRWFRWLGPHFLIDQTFALSEARTDVDEPRAFRRYWLVTGAFFGTAWVATIAAGMLLGPVLPAESPLELAAPAIFIGMLVPQLVHRAAIAAAVAATLATLAAADAPNGSSVIVGAVTGVVAGALADRGRS